MHSSKVYNVIDTCRSFWVSPSHTPSRQNSILTRFLILLFFPGYVWALLSREKVFSHHLISWLTRFPLNAHFYFKTEEDWSCVHFLPSDFILALFENALSKHLGLVLSCALDISYFAHTLPYRQEENTQGLGGGLHLEKAPGLCAH